MTMQSGWRDKSVYEMRSRGWLKVKNALVDAWRVPVRVPASANEKRDGPRSFQILKHDVRAVTQSVSIMSAMTSRG